MSNSELRNPRPEDQLPDDDEGNASIVAEFFWFLRENKKWWMLPLISVFLLVGLLLVLATNPATAPFIYSLF